MTFEEFFKKKKISLPLLYGTEPALHAEFEHHFAQMGEKSFDHTKKYWFNQLRRRYPLPPEVKTEKLVIENPLAEQTITEALTGPATPAPSVGFKPRFKAAVTPPPTEEKPTESNPAVNEIPADTTAQPAAVGFKPRFKASMVAKPAEEEAEEKPVEEAAADAPSAEEAPKPAVGFKPRFKASMVAKPAEEKSQEKLLKEPVADTPSADEAPKPAVGFKPRFKASMVTKPSEEQVLPPAIEPITEAMAPETPPAGPATETPAETPPKPVGFKPRFNAAKMNPKDPDTE